MAQHFISLQIGSAIFLTSQQYARRQSVRERNELHTEEDTERSLKRSRANPEQSVVLIGSRFTTEAEALTLPYFV